MNKQTKLYADDLFKAMLSAQRIAASTLASVEEAKQIVKNHKESAYEKAFAVAQQAASLWDFDKAANMLAEANRKSDGLRDRTVTVAISSIKNYWATLDSRLGETLVIGKGKRQITVTIPKNSAEVPNCVESFSQWRRVADHIKKLDKELATPHSSDISTKWIKAKQLLADVPEERAHAALDRLLADLLGSGYEKPKASAKKAS